MSFGLWTPSTIIIFLCPAHLCWLQLNYDALWVVWLLLLLLNHKTWKNNGWCEPDTWKPLRGAWELARWRRRRQREGCRRRMRRPLRSGTSDGARRSEAYRCTWTSRTSLARNARPTASLGCRSEQKYINKKIKKEFRFNLIHDKRTLFTIVHNIHNTKHYSRWILGVTAI